MKRADTVSVYMHRGVTSTHHFIIRHSVVTMAIEPIYGYTNMPLRLCVYDELSLTFQLQKPCLIPHPKGKIAF